MIVRHRPGELLLITQPDHATLAADVLEPWVMEGPLTGDWRSTLLYATRQHDNGWLEADPLPVVKPDGRPCDFIDAPETIRRTMWPRAAARLGSCRPLAGALIAQHALTIYSRFQTAPAWSEFFSILTVERDRWLESARAVDGPSREAFDRAYDFLHMADLASLIFCNGWTDLHEDRGHRFILLGETLTIAPDPFGGHTVDLRAKARAIPDRRYESDDDLRQALRLASDRWVTGIATGG